MSAPNTNNVGGPRQVACETANKELVAVDIDVLLVSHTFSKMCDELGLEEHNEFPGAFPVRGISSDVFKKVVAWCKEHEGLPEPVIEKDVVTQEVKWLDLTTYEQQFLDMPAPALLELITAANLLHIPSLYHSACQAIAALIKGKTPGKVRLTLRQRCDLSRGDVEEIFSRNPWLVERYEQWVHIQDPINIPAEVLVTILEKLPRADIERFQLVSSQLRDVIEDSQTPFRELSQERGPLRSVDVELRATLDSRHVARSAEEPYYLYLSVDDLVKSLKFCRLRELRTPYCYEVTDALLEALVPLKEVWKDANLDTYLRCFSSDEQFRFAFSEVFMCKKIRLHGYPQASFAPQPFLRLPAVWQCSVLDIDIYNGLHLQTSDIREWLEDGAHKQLVISGHMITGGVERLVDALKTAFLDADRPRAYTVRIKFAYTSQTTQELRNDKTKEQREIRMDGDHDLIVERK